MIKNQVELIYFTDCPNVEMARENICKALGDNGLQKRWIEWDLEDEMTPDFYLSYGSPTVLVNGRDVLVGQAAVTGISCSLGGAPSAREIGIALSDSQLS